MGERRFHLAQEVHDRTTVAAYVQATLATARRDLLLRMVDELLSLDGALAPEPAAATRLRCLRALLRTQRPVPCAILLAMRLALTERERPPLAPLDSCH